MSFFLFTQTRLCPPSGFQLEGRCKSHNGGSGVPVFEDGRAGDPRTPSPPSTGPKTQDPRHLLGGVGANHSTPVFQSSNCLVVGVFILVSSSFKFFDQNEDFLLILKLSLQLLCPVLLLSLTIDTRSHNTLDMSSHCPRIWLCPPFLIPPRSCWPSF